MNCDCAKEAWSDGRCGVMPRESHHDQLLGMRLRHTTVTNSSAPRLLLSRLTQLFTGCIYTRKKFQSHRME